MKSKKLIMIIVGSAVLLIAIGVILFIILANKYERFIEIDVSDCVEKVCEKTVKFNKNILTLTNDKNNSGTLKVNGNEKIIIDNGFPKLRNKIYTFDDNVVAGIDVSEYQTNLYIAPVGKDDTVISILVENTGMTLYDYKIEDILDEDEKVTGKKITLYGTSFISEDTFIYGVTKDTMVKLDSCEAYTKNKDRAVVGIYEIDYLNKEFSDIKKVEETTLENYKDFKNLCLETN